MRFLSPSSRIPKIIVAILIVAFASSTATASYYIIMLPNQKTSTSTPLTQPTISPKSIPPFLPTLTPKPTSTPPSSTHPMPTNTVEATLEESGFSLVSLKDNKLLISDNDVLSYNWTSQEIALSDAASQRLINRGDNLYNFSDVFAIIINGEELYQGVFRSPIMSAIPQSPKISIMFPSMLFPSQSANNHAIRMFYPSFQPPIDQQEKNLKLSQYFKEANKLTH